MKTKNPTSKKKNEKSVSEGNVFEVYGAWSILFDHIGKGQWYRNRLSNDLLSDEFAYYGAKMCGGSLILNLNDERSSLFFLTFSEILIKVQSKHTDNGNDYFYKIKEG